MVSFILAACLGYLVGSIPFAYLLVRWKSNLDIRREGSGNVGTLNSFVVTKSKWVALGVLILDLSKGAGAVFAVRLLIQADFPHGAVGGVSAVAGHSFPVWLGFAGGRGLAPAAGAFCILHWLVVPFWLVLWGVSFLFLRIVNPANAFASAGTLVAVLFVPSSAWEWALREPVSAPWFRGVVVLVMAIILARHREAVQEYLRRGSS